MVAAPASAQRARFIGRGGRARRAIAPIRPIAIEGRFQVFAATAVPATIAR
jgi:hypothetical protein